VTPARAETSRQAYFREMAHGTPRTFVVTGSGRSGTEFISLALSAAGVRCGHEAVFGPRTTGVPPFGPWTGDASWLAAPFLADLPAGTAVLHQVRDPFSVISSWYGLRFLADDGPYSSRTASGLLRLLAHEASTRWARSRGRRVFVARDYERFVARHLPAAVEPASRLDRCMRYWVGWNEMVERAADRSEIDYLRFKLEEVDARWPEILGFIGVDAVEGARPPDLRRSSAGGRASQPNARPHHEVLRREQLVESPEYERVCELAIRYGYPAP